MGNKTFLKVSYGFVVSLLVLFSFDGYVSRGIWYDLLWLLIPIVWGYNVYRFCKHIDKHLVDKSVFNQTTPQFTTENFQFVDIEDNTNLKYKFKIGDRVRLNPMADLNEWNKNIVGLIGVVTELSIAPFIKFDGQKCEVAISEDDLELVP